MWIEKGDEKRDERKRKMKSVNQIIFIILSLVSVFALSEKERKGE